MRLVAVVSRQGIGLPGLSAAHLATLEIGKGAYHEWNVHVRGPAVFLESPPGWNPGSNVRSGADRVVYEIPRAQVLLRWCLDGTETFTGSDFTKYSPPPPIVREETPQESSPAVQTVAPAVPAPAVSQPTIPDDEPEMADPDDPDGLPVVRKRKGRG